MTETDGAVPLRRDAATADYFDMMARDRVPVGRCDRCGRVTSGLEQHCVRCGSGSLTLEPAAGTGTVVTWTTTHDRDGAVLTRPGIVELDEGAWVQAALLPLQAPVETGMPVRAVFHTSADGERYATFTPDQHDEERA